MEVGEDAEKTAARLFDAQKQVTEAKKTRDDVLWLVSEMLKRVALIEGEALVSKLHLSKMKVAGDAVA